MFIRHKYAYCDLQIVPSITTDISSRSECNPYYSRNDYPLNMEKSLPLFTAPMDSVCDDKNYEVFERSGITPIIHRNVPLNKRLDLTKSQKWVAYSLNEFEHYFCDMKNFPGPFKHSGEVNYFVCIDCANGHMTRIFDLAKKAKAIVKSMNSVNSKLKITLTLMSGNIANSSTYLDYCTAGIDYVRCSIGTGSMCLTTANTAVGYPAASLINEIYNLRESYKIAATELIENGEYTLTKIIADGGIKNYSDATVALACGADFVMIGGLFAGCVDSCAEFIGNQNYIGLEHGEHEFYRIMGSKLYNDFKKDYDKLNYPDTKLSMIPSVDAFNTTVNLYVNPDIVYKEDIAQLLVKYFNLNKISHGMSTKEAQIAGMEARGEKCTDTTKLKTSEGKVIEQYVKYTVAQLTDNIISYLKSAMSYTNKRDITEFPGKVELVVKSYGTNKSVNQ